MRTARLATLILVCIGCEHRPSPSNDASFLLTDACHQLGSDAAANATIRGDSGSDAEGDAGHDASVETGDASIGRDADASGDPGTDASADAGSDTASDAAADATTCGDSGSDAEGDNGRDASVETGDASIGPDADASGDPGTDASADAGSDTASDAGDGAGTDAGLTCPHGPSCGPREKLCDGVCVSVLNSARGCESPTCAACALPHAAPTCVDGRCAIGSCEAGFADCDHDPTDGCEANLLNAASCSACGTVCPANTVCTPTGCAESCPIGLTLCGAHCANLYSSPYDCGACNQRATDSDTTYPTCANATPSRSCRPGLTDCSGSCADLASSIDSCGKCGNACSPPSNGAVVCEAGECRNSCPVGWSLCGADCIDTEASATNCGACNRACGGGELCVGGGCVSAESVWLVTGLVAPEDIAADSERVYWTNPGDGTVASVTRESRAVKVLARDQARPVRLAIDRSYVYWSNNLGGAVWRTRKDGSQVDPELVSAASSPHTILVQGGFAYWVNQGDSSLWQAAVDGSSSRTVSPLSGTELLSDGSSLYFTLLGSQNRIARLELATSALDYYSRPIFQYGPRLVAIDAKYLYVDTENFLHGGREYLRIDRDTDIWPDGRLFRTAIYAAYGLSDACGSIVSTSDGRYRFCPIMPGPCADPGDGLYKDVFSRPVRLYSASAPIRRLALYGRDVFWTQGTSIGWLRR
jgi:hypothetical protein